VNRYFLIRRLRVPAMLLLIGTLALMQQMGILHHFWSLFWPLAFILWGLILLAERAVLAVDGYPSMPYPGVPGTGVPPYPGQPIAQYPAQTTSIVPADDPDSESDRIGDRL